MLAINGGIPVRANKKWPVWPPYDNDTIDALVSVLESHRWSPRGVYSGTKSKDKEFCEKFSTYADADYCVLVNSGSAALLLALEALDIGYGDEVIVPVYTWIATAIAVLNINAVPILVDVDKNTGCIDLDEVVANITTKTRAIIPVHLHCNVADLNGLMEISKKHSIPIIEDCAQAHGATYYQKHVGTIGNISAFSFNQEKLLCCGEGGAVITNDRNLYDRAERLHADGSRPLTSPPKIGEYEFEDVPGLLGNNYCPSDFQAAVLLQQLDLLNQRNQKRAENAGYLSAKLDQIKYLHQIQQTPGITSRSYFKYVVRRDPEAYDGISTERICRALSAELGCAVGQTECQPLHQNSLYCPQSKHRHHLNSDYLSAITVSGRRYPNAELHYDTTIVFNHNILLGDNSDMDDIVEAFLKVEKFRESIP